MGIEADSNIEGEDLTPREWLEDRRKIGMSQGLEVTYAMLTRLGMPQMAFPCVHVAGTNGKGTTCVYLANTLSLSGKKTGLFTSPHLCRVEERIRIDGRPINSEQLDKAIHAIKVMSLQEPVLHPTYFETLFLAAMICFKAANVQRAVIETGLGGRLDATRCCYADFTVLTEISLEHSDILGDTIAEIAKEKAAIARPGATMLARWPYDSTAMIAIEEATTKGCGFWWRGDRLALLSFENANEPFREIGSGLGKDGDIIPYGLFDGFMTMQMDNAILGHASAWFLLPHHPGVPPLHDVMERTHWPGRMQQITGPKDVELLLDCAHNPSGIEKMVNELILRKQREEDAGRSFSPSAILVGTTKQKDLSVFVHPIVELLTEMNNPMIVVTEPSDGRLPAVSSDDLATEIRLQFPDARIQVRPDLHVALATAVEEAVDSSSHSIFDGVTGSVWCFGSVHLIGGLLTILGEDSEDALTTMRWKDDDIIGDRDIPMNP